MARRQASKPTTSQQTPDPFDESFSNFDDLNLDDLQIDDLDLGEVEESDTPTESLAPTAPLTPGQVVGGLVQVILIAALALVIFLALGFGMVFGGQRLGIVPTHAPSAAALFASLRPTSAVVALQPTTTPLPPQTATAAAACTGAAAWWNSQQIQDSYVYFTQKALSDAQDTAHVPAQLEQMRIRRNFVANVPTDPCLGTAQAALLRAFDATIDAVHALGSSATAVIDEQKASATKAYTDLADALRVLGVTINLPALAS